MFSNMPPITKALLIANGLVFLLQMILPDSTFLPFMLWPLDGGFGALGGGTSFMPWQLLTYGFLHGNFAHVGFNMLALFMFGAPLEYTWGNRRFLTYYLCASSARDCASWWSRRGCRDMAAASIRPSVRQAESSACCSPTACCFQTSA